MVIVLFIRKRRMVLFGELNSRSIRRQSATLFITFPA